MGIAIVEMENAKKHVTISLIECEGDGCIPLKSQLEYELRLADA